MGAFRELIRLKGNAVHFVQIERKVLLIPRPACLSIEAPKRLLIYVLCRRGSLPRLVGERISVEIKARDRSRIGDSAPQYCGATKRSAERRPAVRRG